MRRLLTHAPLAVTDARWTEPRTKANALLQAHFSRQPLSGDLAADQRTVVLQATRLLQVQLLSSPAYLDSAEWHEAFSVRRCRTVQGHCPGLTQNESAMQFKLYPCRSSVNVLH